MKDVRQADGSGQSATVERSPKRCVRWLDGSVRSAGPAELYLVTTTGVRRAVVTEHTLVLGGPPNSAPPGLIRRGTRVRVGVVRTDHCDLAIIVHVLEAPKPTVDGLAPEACQQDLGAPRLADR